MTTKIRLNIYGILSVLLGFFPFGVFAVTLENPLGTQTLQSLITNVLNAILGLVGLLALAMLIYGGVLLMISGGNQETVDKAKKTITFAVVGLIVAILSTAILNFIMSAVGVNQ